MTLGFRVNQRHRTERQTDGHRQTAMLNTASYGWLHNNIVDIAGSELIYKSVLLVSFLLNCIP